MYSSHSLFMVVRFGRASAGSSLTEGKLLVLLFGGGPVICIDSMRAWLLALTSGIKSEMRFEVVYLLASSISRRVMATPLLGPRYLGVSSLALRRIMPPGRTMSSVVLG